MPGASIMEGAMRRTSMELGLAPRGQSGVGGVAGKHSKYAAFFGEKENINTAQEE